MEIYFWQSMGELKNALRRSEGQSLRHPWHRLVRLETRLKAESRPTRSYFVTGSAKPAGLAPRYVDCSPGQLLRRVNLERGLPRAFGDLMTR